MTMAEDFSISQSKANNLIRKYIPKEQDAG
jgi:hypothetical protein